MPYEFKTVVCPTCHGAKTIPSVSVDAQGNQTTKFEDCTKCIEGNVRMPIERITLTMDTIIASVAKHIEVQENITAINYKEVATDLGFEGWIPN